MEQVSCEEYSVMYFQRTRLGQVWKRFWGEGLSMYFVEPVPAGQGVSCIFQETRISLIFSLQEKSFQYLAENKPVTEPTLSFCHANKPDRLEFSSSSFLLGHLRWLLNGRKNCKQKNRLLYVLEALVGGSIWKGEHLNFGYLYVL